MTASLRAGRVLAAGSTAPAAAVMAFVAGCWPLLACGVYRPWSAALVGGPLAVGAFVATARASAHRARPLSWGAVAAVLLVAVGFGVLAAVWSSQNVVLRRDPGSYALTSTWIADHGTRTIPVGWEHFGGRDPALSASSPAYYPGGDEVVPQFLSGAPMTFAVGKWVGGMHGLFVTPAVLGALAVLALGGLAARLLGGGAAVLAAAALATAYPVLWASRSTYSEPLAMLALLGGMALLLDAAFSERRSAWLALGAGAVLGAATVVRLEALREVALVVPVAVVLAASRRREGWMLGLGLAAGTALGAADGLSQAYPYLHEVRDSLAPLAVATLALALAGGVGAAVVAHRGGFRIPPHVGRALAPLAAGAVLLVCAGLALRPRVAPGTQDPASPGGRTVRSLQSVEHLVMDGTRTYAEQAPRWVSWWMGLPALLLAVAGLAWLAWRSFSVRRPLPGAAPVVLVLFGSAVLVLLRPGITPDHPWADRRLVPVVLPVVALGAAAAVDALVTLVRRRGVAPLLAAVLAAGVLVPGALATKPLLGARTEHGELAAVQTVCTQVRPGDVAFLLDLRARREWTQPLRGMCGVPAVGVLDRTQLPRLMARARAAGSTPVLVAVSYPERITEAGAKPVRTVGFATKEDSRLLSTRPDEVVRLPISLWIARV